MKLQKWNNKTNSYEEFESPAKHIKLYCENMDELAECANCAKPCKYGDMYTSRTIHTPAGLGYGVCNDCYGVEISNIELDI